MAMSNPHDALFKAVCGNPEHAQGMLQTLAPAALTEAIEWAKLTRRPGSFVDPHLREQHTDLLFSARWLGGGEALLYFLFEHQSAPDGPLIAFRLLRYQVRIWEDWRARNPDAKTLPVIVPLVLYHGAAAWPAPRAFEDLFEVPAHLRPALEPQLVRFTYLLDDLSAVSDDELRERARMTALARLTAACFKHGRKSTDIVEVLRGGWADVLRDVSRAPNGREALVLVMRYILQVNEYVGPEALETLLIGQVGSDAKDIIMTAGQQLIHQGRQLGRCELFLDLLRQRFGDQIDANVEHRIATASPEQIKVWSERVLSAGSLSEVLAD